MCPIYTKSFGGKIWRNLHSVSPDYFLDKKFKMASPLISRQNFLDHHLVQKKFKVKRQFLSYHKKKFEKRYFNLITLRNIVLFQTFLHEMMFRINNFLRQFSFVKQDKLDQKRQTILTVLNNV